ncbi:hypothetical protein FE257_001399 [Aspergillus nanangensis]|uniref:Uncharacterized protein n=1 Tax=Aspergillus nanangensis TaxID=2582783 RepID=A0AAD4CDV5_ASPNN|nr:hypothetical protein FE257_001399 [Aspergillus nanangensis]
MLSPNEGEGTDAIPLRSGSTNSQSHLEPTADAICATEGEQSEHSDFTRKASSVIISMDLEEKGDSRMSVLSSGVDLSIDNIKKVNGTSHAISQAFNGTMNTSKETIKASTATPLPTETSHIPVTDQSRERSDTKQYNLRSLSKNGKSEAPPPDTQESMMFNQRRSTKKVYTSHSKAAVDWGEDFRPSCSENGGGSRKDSEVTFISSPLPGDDSAFNRSNRTTGNKRKRQGSISARKAPNRQAKRKKIVKGPAVLETALPGNRSQKKVDTRRLWGNTKDIERAEGVDAALEYKEATNYTESQSFPEHSKFKPPGSIANSSQVIEQNDSVQTRKETDGTHDQPGKTASENDEGLHGKGVQGVSGRSGETLKVIESRPQENADTGRGQEVGRKLAAAFNGSMIIITNACPPETHSAGFPPNEAMLNGICRTGQSPGREQHAPNLMGTEFTKDSFQIPRTTPRQSVYYEQAMIRNFVSGANTNEDGSLTTDSQITWSQSDMSPPPPMINSPAHEKVMVGAEAHKRQIAGARPYIGPGQEVPAAIYGSTGTPRMVVVDRNGSPRIMRQKPEYMTRQGTSPMESRAGADGETLRASFYGPESGSDGDSSAQELGLKPPSHSRVKSFQQARSSRKSLFEPKQVHDQRPGVLHSTNSQSSQTKLTLPSELSAGGIEAAILLSLRTKSRRTSYAAQKSLQAQLSKETQVIRDVLDAYHRQCYQVLDQLFDMQEERIQLCEKQKNSIQDHHANICQELIDRLKANKEMGRRRKLSTDLATNDNDQNNQGRWGPKQFGFSG